MSHLGKIIHRVKKAERRIRRGKLTGPAADKERLPHLINLWEYMHYWTDFNESEKIVAEHYLAKYSLKIESQSDADRLLKTGYGRRTCVRCGRELSREESIKRGMGEICAERGSI